MSDRDSKDTLSSLRQRVVGGGVWWGATYPIAKSMHLVANIVLAWLLTPQAFGLMAIAEAIHRGGKTLSEVGLNISLVQSRREDEAFVNTIWTMQVLRGVGIWILLCLLAWPIARFYGEPMMVGILAATGFGSALKGIASTSYVMFNRRLNERPRALLDLGVVFAARASMIAAACWWPSVWALVIGNLVGDAVFAVGTHRLSNGPRNRLAWDRDAAREVFGFGRWIVIGSMLAFLGSNLDRFMLSKLNLVADGLALLGVYAIAQRVARLPGEAVHAVAGRMYLPVVSEVVRSGADDSMLKIRRTKRLIVWPALWMCLAVVVLSPLFFRVVYDMRYLAAGWIAPLCVAGVWLGVLNACVSGVLLARGRSRPQAGGAAMNFGVTLVGGVWGGWVWGVPGFVLGIAAGDLMKYLYELWVFRHLDASWWAEDAGLSLLLLLLAGGAYWLAWISGWPTAFRVGVVSMLLLITAGVGARVALVSFRSGA